MDAAEQWIGLTDGGNGLENFLRTNFPRDLVVILDFWHAAEYLADLAKALHPGDEERSRALTAGWCQTMKHEGGAAVVGVLERLDLPRRKPAVAAKRAEVLGYLRNNVHRMDYPTYVANGWLIGSGAVESACKTVVGQRLKLAGMRRGEDGTDSVCHLRALFKSERGQGATSGSVASTNRHALADEQDAGPAAICPCAFIHYPAHLAGGARLKMCKAVFCAKNGRRPIPICHIGSAVPTWIAASSSQTPLYQSFTLPSSPGTRLANLPCILWQEIPSEGLRTSFRPNGRDG